MAVSPEIREAEELHNRRATLLQDLQDSYLKCRELGHAWEEEINYVARKHAGWPQEIVSLFRCTRCTTERKDVLHGRTYELMARSYRYPLDYKMPESGWTRREHIRAEKFRRNAPMDAAPHSEEVEVRRVRAS